jgi:hypothetical protein
MCGLSGILVLEGAPPDEADLAEVNEALWHRGPDPEGQLIDAAARPAVGLARRRLSIIDLSAQANQPLANEDGSVHAVLNGEIYNHAELRRGLGIATISARQATPRSSSTATRSRPKTSSRRSTACLPWLSGTVEGDGWCWPGTPSARSPCTTRTCGPRPSALDPAHAGAVAEETRVRVGLRPPAGVGRSFRGAASKKQSGWPERRGEPQPRAMRMDGGWSAYRG